MGLRRILTCAGLAAIVAGCASPRRPEGYIPPPPPPPAPGAVLKPLVQTPPATGQAATPQKTLSPTRTASHRQYFDQRRQRYYYYDPSRRAYFWEDGSPKS
jgi:hypothetical protein